VDGVVAAAARAVGDLEVAEQYDEAGLILIAGRAPCPSTLAWVWESIIQPRVTIGSKGDSLSQETRGNLKASHRIRGRRVSAGTPWRRIGDDALIRGYTDRLALED